MPVPHDIDKPVAVPQRRWADDESERKAQAASINARTYQEAGVGKSDFLTLDLSPYVNRAFGPRSAWLGGDPLRHFEPGAHEIHGIPFKVARGRNRRHSAIVLRSRKGRSSDGEDLPVEVKVKAGTTASSIYLLHAAGWTLRHEAFAAYEFVFADGTREVLDVVAFSQGPHSKRQEASWTDESVVQDWHPSSPPFHSARALPYLLTEKGDPLLYERYLYTYHWTNPHPAKPIKSILVRSLMPDARATLAVLAITAEKQGRP